MSRIEQYELKCIRENIELDPISNIWTAKYPYKLEPTVLDNNFNQVYNIMINTEENLSKNEAFQKKWQQLSLICVSLFVY